MAATDVLRELLFQGLVLRPGRDPARTQDFFNSRYFFFAHTRT